MNIEELGFTREELADRAAMVIVDRLMNRTTSDEYGDEVQIPSDFRNEMQKEVMKGIEAKISEIAERSVIPLIHQRIEDMVLQETNKWGEAKGDPITFQEYMVQRAEHYMVEPVNYEGKSKSENGAYSWSKSTTRICHLIDNHLKYNIENAMKKALENANSAIVGGMNTAMREQLAVLSQKMGVELKVKR